MTTQNNPENQNTTPLLGSGQITLEKRPNLRNHIRALNGTRGRGSYFVRVKLNLEWNEIQIKLTDGQCTRAEYGIDIGHTQESKREALEEAYSMVKHFIEI